MRINPALTHHWRINIILGLCWVFTALCCNATPASELSESSPFLHFNHLLDGEEASIGQVYSILQDRQGLMWFAGVNGVANFDGYRINIYHHQPNQPDSLSDSVVWSMIEDSDGNLWFASENGINRYDREQDNFIRYQHDPLNPHSLSHNFTRAIIEDHYGDLWIGTRYGLDRLDRSTGNFHHYRHQINNSNSLSHDHVISLLEDKQGNLWVGTQGGGLNHFNRQTNTFTHYRHDSTNTKSLSNDHVGSIYQDKSGNIWAGTDHGLNLLNLTTNTFKRFMADPDTPHSLGSNIIHSLLEDLQGNFWVATDGGGLNLLDKLSGKVTRYLHTPDNEFSINSNTVWSLFEDRYGDLWTGNFPTGVNHYDRVNTAFRTVRHTPLNRNGLNHSSVLAFYEDEKENLWLGTDGGGLNYVDHKTGQFSHFRHNSKDPGSLSSDAVLAIHKDSLGTLWVGTWAGGLNRLDPDDDKFTHYNTSTGLAEDLTGNHVWDILEDDQGDIWLASQWGLDRYNRKTDSFTHYRHNPEDNSSLGHNGIWSLYQDRQGYIWVGTHQGLDRFDKKTGIFKHYRHQPGNSESLSHNWVISIFEDSRSRLWIGTHAGGLNLLDRKTDTISAIQSEGELPSPVILGILEGEAGNLWLSTHNGIVEYSPARQSLRHFDKQHRLQGNIFNLGAALKTRKGQLLFGGTKGFNSFYPHHVSTNPIIPPIIFTDFKIANQSARIGATGSPLTKAINQTKNITLTPEQTVISFEFAALNYRIPNKNQYAYKLDGFDKDWNYVGTQRTATYTNLDPGKYTFQVKASNNEGIWNNEGKAVQLKVLPPWWQTWWAYCAYLLVCAGIIWLLSYTLWQRRKAEQEHRINQRLLDLDKTKDAFLANTSHELRTPLNGIIGLAESLIDGVTGKLPETTINNLEMIVESGKRLADLINDILDLSKLKHHTLTLHPQAVDLHSLTDIVISLCQPLLQNKPVQLLNVIPDNLPAALADENRLQQILYNLIGNATKFTEAGTITVSAMTLLGKISVRVQDTGIGIATDKIDRIFDSFEQVDNESSRDYEGAGLGLAVTRQLVELHGGEISVESTPGEGSVFTFSLPLVELSESNRSQASSPFSTSETTEISRSLNAPLAETKKQQTEKSSENNFHILIVDDGKVNRQVLRNHLAMQHYQLTECANGQEALDILSRNNSIDLVLLDVMMPRMSGYEVCQKLRQHYSSEQLPIIFLTARNQAQDLETAYSVGGNDFLSKPISKDELLARVNTHLRLLEISRYVERDAFQ